MDTKQCKKCELVLPTTEFPKEKRNKDGLFSYCHTCNRQRKREGYYRRQGREVPVPLPEGLKRCYICKEIKPFSDFHKRGKTVRSECKGCSSEVHKLYIEKRGPTYQRTLDQTRKARNMRKIISYLLEHPCVDCGEADPLVLEFDHIEPCIGRRVTTQIGRTWEIILAEITKCEVRCSSCHRRITHKRANSLRYQLCKTWKGWIDEEEIT